MLKYYIPSLELVKSMVEKDQPKDYKLLLKTT